MKTKLLISALLLSFLNCSAQYTKLLDFAGTANGSRPVYSSLVSDGTFLYGMTKEGGTGGGGLVFKIKPNGTAYDTLMNFLGYNGSVPYGSLISDGTFLYGMTFNGGINDYGTVFKIKPDGTGYSLLHEFLLNVNGYWPYGSLVSDGNFLYGMTSAGGANNKGVVFKVKTDGTGYSILFDFAGGINGDSPNGSLFLSGTYLYGMTRGGALVLGNIFKIKTDGTGYSNLFDFAGTSNGSSPFGSLISDGTYLYGMTRNGGSTNCNNNGCGLIFKIKLDGTGFTILHNYSGSGSDGIYPYGTLILNGTFLYGMTEQGGTGSCPAGWGCGTIFQIKTDGTMYSKLFDFAGATSGSLPEGSLYSDGTFVYGMTNFGGANSKGVIFKYHPLGMGITESELANAINLYPNPTNGIFIMQIDNEKLSKGELSIYNVLGEKVYEMINTLLNNTSIDLSNQPNGIYFINIKTSEGIVSKKVIINK